MAKQETANGKSKLSKESLGFRRDGMELNHGGMHLSFSEASLSLSSESNGHDKGGQNVVRKRHGANSRKLLPKTSSSLILQSIIQHLCSLYEQDAERRKKLFVSICSSLSKMNVMSPTFQFDELTALRSHYQHAFAKLIKVAQGSLDGNRTPFQSSHLPLPGPNSPLSPDETYLYHHSRFATEFEELSFLAKGGFGSVFKVRNRLDDAYYAIKKIILKHRHQDLFVKILREVTTLAQLTHPNIVCYKTAWLEPYLSSSDSSRKTSSTDEDESSSDETTESTSQSNPFLMDKNQFLDGCEELQNNRQSRKSLFSENESSTSHANDFVDDDEETSWGGVVFQADDIDSTDGIKKRRSNKKLVDEKVIRCKIFEVDELDSEEEELPCVIGMAATPPQNVNYLQKHRSKVRSKIFDSSGDKLTNIGGKKATNHSIKNGSKFWIGDSSEMSSCSGSSLAKPQPKTKQSKKCHRVSFASWQTESKKLTTTTAKMTSLVSLDGTASLISLEGATPYWSKKVLSDQALKLDLLFNKSLTFEDLRKQDSGPTPNHEKAVLFIQMQLCERTLRSWLDERNEKIQSTSGTVCFEENVEIFRQILSGVCYIHSKGIVHRDLKPRNIFIDCENRVQIGDFGLAKKELFEDSSTPTSPTEFTPPKCSSQMTSTNHPTLQRKPSQHTSGVGTQAYAAPEQLTKGQIDFKSDMYSLGIILFELFNAFTTSMERSCAISSLRSLAAGGDSHLLPPEFCQKFPIIDETIRRLTFPNPSDRPSASELLTGPFSHEVATKPELSRLENENLSLREKVKCQELQISIQQELISKQQARIELLEKMISSKLFVIK